MAPSHTRAGSQRNSDDDSVVALPKQASSPRQPRSPTATRDAVPTEPQQSELQDAMAQDTEGHPVGNNGRSPRTSEQAEDLHPTNGEPEPEGLDSPDDMAPQAGATTAEAALVEPADPVMNDDAATSADHNGEDDFVDQLQASAQGPSSLEEATVQAASSSAQLGLSTQADTDNLVAADTASADAVEPQTQAAADQPTVPQSPGVSSPFEDVEPAVSNDRGQTQITGGTTQALSNPDRAQMQPQLSLPAVASTSDRSQMQSQASLPPDSNARAAAVAEAIKRAAQASGQGQPQPHGDALNSNTAPYDLGLLQVCLCVQCWGATLLYGFALIYFAGCG